MAAFAPALGQSLRSRPPRNSSGQQGSPRQLEFGSAMKDFKSMFPEMDDEVIEAVLRANNGLVDATIDQLLTMGAVSGDNSTNSSDLPFLPSYNDTETQEPPPAYTPREGALIDVEDSEPRPLPARPYSAWNPPLLGTLPDDFLRLGPSSMQARVHPNPPSQTTPKQQTTAEHDLEQFLEDEKLAMILQNEEFMRELRHNSDFMMSLEKDRQQTQLSSKNASATSQIPSSVPSLPAPPLPDTLPTPVSSPYVASVSTSDHNDEVRSDPAPCLGATASPTPHTHHDDIMLREKLRHMGKSTRKKFDKIARVFQRKKNTQQVNLINGSSQSTANLLEDYEDDDDDDLLNVMGAGRLEIMDEKAEDDSDLASRAHMPNQATGQPKAKVTSYEPIVFFAEDNEFEYKNEK